MYPLSAPSVFGLGIVLWRSIFISPKNVKASFGDCGLKNRIFLWSLILSISNLLVELSMAVGPRIRREKKTVDAMIHLYCEKHHGTRNELCSDCGELYEYAMLRLSKCPFQENKSTCAKCLVHCYEPNMKKKIAKIMRYSGPRMLIHHPILALRHVFDGRKKPESLKK